MKLKTISIFLALLMCSFTIVSCSDKTQSDESDIMSQESESSAEETQIETMEGYDINGYLLDDIPEDTDFNAQKVSVLYWKDAENPEFWVEEFNGEPVNDAINQRNINVEDRLNIVFNWVPEPGDYGSMYKYARIAEQSVMADDGAYDIFSSYSMTIGIIALNGIVTDLYETQYIDYEKPWWPSLLVEESMIGDKLYFISGDISTNILYMMHVIYYNKEMLEDYNLSDPTEHAFAGTWTFDKMIEYTNGIYRDLNGNGKKDKDDVFGYGSSTTSLDMFYTAAGLKFLEKDEENYLKLSDDVTSEMTLDLLAKIGPYLQTQDVYISDNWYASTIFAQERMLFLCDRTQVAAKTFREVDFVYGILPSPKYDENQKDYKTLLGNPITLYSVSRGSKIGDITHAVLECAASQAYRLTTPAVFENNMKKKFSNDDIDAQMYDIVRETISFELGRFLDISAKGEIQRALASNSQKWASSAAKREKVYRSQVNGFIKKFLEAEDNLQ